MEALYSLIKQLMEDGACVICLANGIQAFPVDPRYHKFRTGHFPRLVITAPWEAR